MELLSVIRRWAFRDRLSIREISRRTNLSRNTIRKYLRSDVVEPAFKVPDRPSKLDAFADKLSAWLKVEGGRPRKQKRTVKQLHADLVALGFDGSYGRVSAFARAWKTARQREQQTAGRGVFVPLCQFSLKRRLCGRRRQFAVKCRLWFPAVGGTSPQRGSPSKAACDCLGHWELRPISSPASGVPRIDSRKASSLFDCVRGKRGEIKSLIAASTTASIAGSRTLAPTTRPRACGMSRVTLASSR